MGIKVKVDIPNPSKSIDNIVDKRVGLFTAETCARYFAPYVPRKKGNLFKTYTTEPFKITYEMPYAHRVYNGTGMNFSKEKHPQATSEWDKASMSANRDKIAKEISNFIKKG